MPKPARSSQPPAIRLRDRELEERLESLRSPGETLGQCAGRLLWEYLAILDGLDSQAALREIRATAERALGVTAHTPA